MIKAMKISHYIHSVAFCALLALSFPAQATPDGQAVEQDMVRLQINQPGDIDLDCEEISQEVLAMQALISEMTDRMDKSRRAKQGVGIVETVGTYAVGSLGGAIGIMAAGFIVANAADDRADDADTLIEAAQQRRSFMAGIYNVKGCMGPLDLAEIEPAAGNEEPIDLYQHKPYYND